MKFILLFLLPSYLLALVTIKPVEIGEKEGLYTKLGGSFETKRGNTEKQNNKAFVRFTYDNTHNAVTWLEFSAEYGKSFGRRDTNKAFAHLRHIRKTPLKDLNFESFGQIQDDSFRFIKKRSLLGVGGRYKLFSIYGEDSGYFGFGAMYEMIRYSSNDPQERNKRFNSYLAYTTKIDERSSFTYTLYYQPKFDNSSDFVSVNSAELKVHLIKKLFLQINMNYNYDSVPALGIKKYDLTQLTSFVLEF